MREYPRDTIVFNVETLPFETKVNRIANLSWFCLHDNRGLNISTATLDKMDNIKNLLGEHYSIIENMIYRMSPEHIDYPWFWFSRLSIHKKNRGQGWGAAFMEAICKVADREKFHILNGVNPYGEMSLEQTISFYEKYGFIGFDSEHPEMLVRICK